MKWQYLCVLLFVATAASLKFNVVYPGSTNAQVSVGGTNYPMTRKYPDVPFYQANLTQLTGSPNYKYIVDGVAETFDRTFPEGKSKTYNDFFGRQETVKKLTEMGWPFTEKAQWTRNSGGDGVFGDDYINTVIFIGPRIVEIFNVTYAKDKFKDVQVAMINKEDEGYWTNAELNMEDTTQERPNLKIQLEENYNKRSDFKFRPSISDPTFIRDKLYNDVLEAIGCPHTESGFARVYVEGAGLGLYNLQEKVGGRDFVKTQFYGKQVVRPDPMGSPLDAKTGAEFAPGTKPYAFEPPKNESNAGVLKLINALAALDVTSIPAIEAFDRDWWSIEHFFRAMAVEYLSGHYDSYLWMTTNFMIYNDPTEGSPGTLKYYFVDEDFDQTYGVNLSPQYNPYNETFTSQPYTVYVNKYWNITGSDPTTRAMWDRLLTNPTYKAKFEEILKTIVKGVWNPIALNRRIDSIIGRLRPEITWDRTLGKSRAHQPNLNMTYVMIWSVADLDNGMTQKLRGNWGLKTFIQERADAVAKYFNIEFQNPPLDPPAKETTTTTDSDSSDDDEDGPDLDGTTGNSGTTGQAGTTGQTSTGVVTTGVPPVSTTGVKPSLTSNGVSTTGPVITNPESSAERIFVSIASLILIIAFML